MTKHGRKASCRRLRKQPTDFRKSGHNYGLLVPVVVIEFFRETPESGYRQRMNFTGCSDKVELPLWLAEKAGLN